MASKPMASFLSTTMPTPPKRSNHHRSSPRNPSHSPHSPKKFQPSHKSASKPPRSSSSQQGWDPVAEWYDKLVGDTGSDYHRNVILPAVLKHLNAQPHEDIIDFCCGQGVLARPLLESGVQSFTGIDASPRLIQAANQRHANHPNVNWLVHDVCQPIEFSKKSYHAATCIMAVHDVPEILPLFTNIAKSLTPQGRGLCVLMHPCFRIPQKSHWGWDPNHKIQYRRLDCYASPQAIAITTHPGKASSEQTHFHHRSLADLITAITQAGLSITGCEELFSHRRSQANGPFSKAEHRAAEEFPLFLMLSYQKSL